jgi:hypothetical protein
MKKTGFSWQYRYNSFESYVIIVFKIGFHRVYVTQNILTEILMHVGRI